MKVFYSWQKDLPNPTNRGFIEKALENAAKSIRNDDSIQVEPVIDRDTIGVPGAPDIASTIFAKIDEAYVFVCDVSIINSGTESRPTPNPNVLIELGYAIKSLGAKRIMMVLNTAFGAPETLPFDLRTKRVVTYHMPVDSQDRAAERKRLEDTLEQGLRTIFERVDTQAPTVTEPSLSEQARTAIDEVKPNQALLVRRFMTDLVETLDGLNPDFSAGGELDEVLVDAIGRTEAMVIEFARVAESIATMNALEPAISVLKGFAPILDRYNVKSGYSGVYRTVDYDFYKFIGHELFVTLFTFLIQENRWELVTQVLDEDIFVENSPEGTAGAVPFYEVSQYVELLAHRNKRLKLSRMSVHADILNERHSTGDLGALVPIQKFAAADYFLFLRGELQKEEPDGWVAWKPWSALYLRQPPQYLVEAVRLKNAEKLVQPLGVPSVEAIRTRLAERKAILDRLFGIGNWRNTMRYFDAQTIGSR